MGRAQSIRLPAGFVESASCIARALGTPASMITTSLFVVAPKIASGRRAVSVRAMLKYLSVEFPDCGLAGAITVDQVTVGKSMFSSSPLSTIKAMRNVRHILGSESGGVHKRIDENRELLELLQQEAPNFLEMHFWVEGWLSGYDEFFEALARDVVTDKGLFRRHALRSQGRLPRQWPGAPLKSTAH